jgi:pimeloyl-ACP methyl ester carboxylesterase
MAEDLRAFLAAMNLPAAVIVGHSMGSMVAQRFAIDHPARAKGLILAGAFASIYQHAVLGEYAATVVVGLTDPVDREVAMDFQVSTLAHEISAEFLDTVVRESLKVPARG